MARGRFIPACAGNSVQPSLRMLQRSVHPRVRGEQIGRRIAPAKTHGSSPRARGTVQVQPSTVLQVRFIPACAGNRIFEPFQNLISSVHPRVRGEQIISLRLVAINTGSSPRARGTGDQAAQPVTRWRFIPACAGNRALLAAVSEE